MFDICSIAARYTVDRCSIDIRWMFDTCSIDVQWMFDSFSIAVRGCREAPRHRRVRNQVGLCQISFGQELRGDPTGGMWRRKSWRGSGRRSCRPSFGSGRRSRCRRRWGIAWILFLAAWQGCADGDVIVRCWETAKDVRYSRSMFIGRRMVDSFSIYRRTEVR